jgi:phosphohistidine phosphatase
MSAAAADGDVLALVPDVTLAPGTHKYVLLRVSEPAGAAGAPRSKVVVRSADREFHKGVKQETERELRGDPRTAALSVSCPGGGRIRHEPEAQRTLVYGFSNAYGRGDHALACELIRRAFPAFDVSFSNEGY